MPDSAFDPAALAIVRRAYAKQILAVAQLEDPRLEAAFAAVPRERFLGPPPWQIASLAGGYRALGASDPVLAYQDVLFALAPHRGVNNGSPSLHARLLHALALRDGERVVHVGAGTGYYSALLAELVGPGGQVVAVEFDAALAASARANLVGRANIEVVAGDGALWPREPADAVYVNFAAARPADAWIERLAPGGRLVFPLSVPAPNVRLPSVTHAKHGAALLVERRSRGLAARSLGPAWFVWAEGALAGDAAHLRALAAAFERGGVEAVRSLRWKDDAAAERSWFDAGDWSLSCDPPAE
jgi:protein-L-isoaspartate(D-aspartate) O-methyltransferase